MAKIKTNETDMARQIKIEQRRFDALLIMRTTWFHLDGSSEMQQPRLNLNDSYSCISSEPLIID